MNTLLPILPAFAALLLMMQPAAHATVAIYSGTEIERVGTLITGQGSIASGTHSSSSPVYFLYEIETGRSIEVRLVRNGYMVRKERSLVHVSTPRSSSTTGPATMDTILITGARMDAPNGATVANVTWNGTKKYNVLQPEFDSATGLPVVFPRTFSSLQDFTFADYESDAVNSHVSSTTRRRSSVTIVAPLTKASNAAAESLDGALQRLKTALEARGRAEQEPPQNGIDR
jgi:hypothetical protein